MKILLLTNAYPPEIGGAANLCSELAHALKSRGHTVSVVTRFPRHLPKEIAHKTSGKWLVKEKHDGIEIFRINIPEFSRKIPLMREFDYLLHIIFLFIASLMAGKADVILTSSPPLVMGYAAIMVRLFHRNKVVLNVQDIFPQNMVDLGVMKNRQLIAFSRLLEKDIYRRSDLLTVMSEGNKQIVDKTSKKPDIVSVVENWIDADYIVPGKKHNGFREEFGLGNKFILSFAGCIADSQDMDIILNSAKKLEQNDDILFLIAGNGPRYEDTMRKIRELELKNVKVIPIQPRDKYVNLLAASDVGMVTLNPRVATPTVPSKIKSIMSAGRPVLASFPLDGDAPKLINSAKCGVVVEAGDEKAFYEAILTLYNSQQLREEYGKNGRSYILKNLTVQSAAEQYESLFKKVLTK